MKKALLTAAALAVLVSPAMAADMTKASNEAQFRTNLMGLGGLSLEASQMAVEKASDAKVKEFATFEVDEQTAIASVLKDSKTPKPPMDADAKATLEKLKSASGEEFDKAYVAASLDTHEKLQSLAETYKASPMPAKAGAMEKEARHLATVALPTIKQHIAQSKELSSGM